MRAEANRSMLYNNRASVRTIGLQLSVCSLCSMRSVLTDDIDYRCENFLNDTEDSCKICFHVGNIFELQNRVVF